ncbi:16S rRNA (cytidine(1402)-2'-O)-methyltransferase [Candidatus Giovannonibacteria bacterium RIFCSPLOWO2_01_FULL_43_160]|uniref:Ribosomal RNA small subunit methyltransferase I n=2 Tax=Candidatus Giovannoniibacteriota TaxID=1752738 RepID=A0A0G1IVP2_9BACT|nr:MAG: Ribosomal RNA small subunit methyltransferase I [Candidatus Giovannonibacteria bacterium GW2011_GWB1_43_13]KKS99533.1 MAG: Ribosomal RNA small subunit methyltransferase I [Candidatus Giovannonibacteria bacterium GW2011_GWA1_43_15]KKT21431.1 MAG: Ribosomal RNA small subunit methyltransferase I [Candidatus Giovannonibacteria bacterium GW2011_GWC2_43_8]KKT63481.1 MAG: Ribosomal RNA small subunit methyltransferase I [Candidatus Giovannonibacteria bacterium GW2011_GWA2_44_26]OGF58134.1 MAG: 
MAKLFIIATSIGNLGDITLRALEVLKSVDFILAEDTRVTKKLLSHFGIHKPVLRYLFKKDYRKFNSIALVTDAGTPAVSDPGAKLVKNLTMAGFEIIPVPGPSALSAMISISDIDMREFCFLGFPPRKKGRQTFFKRVAKFEIPIILFESPHRIQKTLRELELVCGDRYVNIGRELTKIYEEVFRGKLSEAQKYFIGEKIRGEFVIALDLKR